jgi:hypothetical protein
VRKFEPEDCACAVSYSRRTQPKQYSHTFNIVPVVYDYISNNPMALDIYVIAMDILLLDNMKIQKV